MEKIKNNILKRDNFTCKKCMFVDTTGKELEIHHIKPLFTGGKNQEENLVTLCTICHKYAPDSEKDFNKYLNEKIDGTQLDTFRLSSHSISRRTTWGMINKFKKGNHLTKAPRGYKLLDKKLIPDGPEQITNIFEEFLDSDISLTQLAKTYNMTTAGIKKLLKNTTYLGKVKFAGKESEGVHKAILSKELFEKVQNKLENISRK